MSSTRPTISFGWYVVAASFAIMFLNAGARLMIGVLVKPMIADFGWSRSAVSLAVFINMAVFAAAIVVAGRLYDRYGAEVDRPHLQPAVLQRPDAHGRDDQPVAVHPVLRRDLRAPASAGPRRRSSGRS